MVSLVSCHVVSHLGSQTLTEITQMATMTLPLNFWVNLHGDDITEITKISVPTLPLKIETHNENQTPLTSSNIEPIHH